MTTQDLSSFEKSFSSYSVSFDGKTYNMFFGPRYTALSGILDNPVRNGRRAFVKKSCNLIFTLAEEVVHEKGMVLGVC